MGRRTADAQGLVEYSLIVLFVAMACIAAVTAFGVSVSGALGSINGSL